MIYGEHRRAALGSEALYGKCAKTHIIVDWGAGCELGAVIGHAGQPGHGFLHQKYNIIIYGDS